VDLQRLADISQIVSAMAVVVSLLILAAEVRRAGREVVMASQQAQAMRTPSISWRLRPNRNCSS
jgi:hypothetical protein